jgi:hypothetical protein
MIETVDLVILNTVIAVAMAAIAFSIWENFK